MPALMKTNARAAVAAAVRSVAMSTPKCWSHDPGHKLDPMRNEDQATVRLGAAREKETTQVPHTTDDDYVAINTLLIPVTAMTTATVDKQMGFGPIDASVDTTCAKKDHGVFGVPSNCNPPITVAKALILSPNGERDTPSSTTLYQQVVKTSSGDQVLNVGGKSMSKTARGE